MTLYFMISPCLFSTHSFFFPPSNIAMDYGIWWLHVNIQVTLKKNNNNAKKQEH